MATCVTVPAAPEILAQPAYLQETPVFAWEQGADSVDILDGDVRVASEMPISIGVVWGFTQTRDNVALERITHGLYFFQTDRVAKFQVMEAGKRIGSPTTYVPLTDIFEVVRVGTQVFYRVNGRRVYLSRVSSTGELSVGSAMFASGDYIP